MSDQPTMEQLLREASEQLQAAVDKLDAAQIAEQQTNEKLRERFRDLVRRWAR